MSEYENNVQAHPEKWGLKVVAEIEYSNGCYVFDTRIVWADESGKLYTARDAGCSCPTPFENFNTMNDIDTFDWQALQSEVDQELMAQSAYISPLQAREFLKTVEEAMSTYSKYLS